MADVIRAMFSNPIVKGVKVGLIIGAILGTMIAVHMFINNIELSTVINMVQEFDLGNELIKLLVNTMK